MERIDYVESGENLPDWMQDFHDQKDLFKAIYDLWKGSDNAKVLDNITWVDAHVYTIDVFLWWMGLHGYKLQKSRKKGVDFYDPIQTIEDFKKARNAEIAKIFAKTLKEKSK